MKLKKIMIITLLLLAVFSIAAVSASDEVASDGLNATDDANIVEDDVLGSADDYDDIYVEDDEICIDENDDEYDEDVEIAYICPLDNEDKAKGSFQILKGNDILARFDINKASDWEIDEYDDPYAPIYLKDILTKIEDGDILSFKFLELRSGQYVPLDDLTVTYKVARTDSTLKLTKIGGEIDEEDVEIQVNNANITSPDDIFIHVTVPLEQGIFKISFLNDKGEEYIIFREDLSTTSRHPRETEDEFGDLLYIYDFSLTDLNNYISKTGDADSFKDLVDKNLVPSGSELDFELCDSADEDEAISSITVFFTIKDGMILFIDEDAVEAMFRESSVAMKDGWNETEVLEYIVKKGVQGSILINIGDAPAFNKTLSELTPVDSDDSDDYNYYSITIADLNITQKGKYTITYYFTSNGVSIPLFDEDSLDILEIVENQSSTVGDITVDINAGSVLITTDNDALITISDNNALPEDEIWIYVDGNETKIIVKISDCVNGTAGEYIITPNKLTDLTELALGKHNLNVTYKNVNGTGEINLDLGLVIEFPYDNEIIYNNLEDDFVYIRLSDGDIYQIGIGGKINLTITDENKNVIDTIEKDLENLNPVYDSVDEIHYYVINTNDLNKQIVGNYTVVARYIYEYGGEITEKSNVTFKTFDSKEYEPSFNENLDDEDAYAFTFPEFDPNFTVIVDIDGNKTVIDGSDVNCDDNGVYYLKSSDLGNLKDGSHLITVSVSSGKKTEEIGKSNIIVDLEENFNLNLTVNVADIEEGNAANLVITTNSTFTGNVTVQVADKNYTVKVEKGKGSIPISGLSAGTYTATAFFKSNGIFNDAVKSTTFKVTAKPAAPAKKEAVIKLTLKNVKVKKSAKKLVLSATLKINGKAAKKGTKLVFKFKNKKFKAKVGKKGVAKYTIKAKMLKKLLKKVKVGKKVKYQVTYGGKTVSRTVKVKK